MALSLILRSSSRLPALVNASRISCATATHNPLLCSSSPVNNVRPISVSPTRQSATGNHVTLWQAERLLSLGMLGIVPVALVFPSQGADYLLAISIVMHSHWGLEAIVTDYVRESVFGNILPKAAHGLLILFSAATLAGLFMMAYNDQGLGKTVRKIWGLKSN
ncbi:CLUMA_CG002119, isoform A [Clunio marinus]|uniref:Succinate dehydrogenase [ubiquinone] cytochrome b small subunit n=1 Tax=Clunio marinus TaxID=568069 RepID=A0A1J1HJY9_9DIPT|nr:CLUMA_CG002119, isoform A [Clunio marinus]